MAIIIQRIIREVNKPAPAAVETAISAEVIPVSVVPTCAIAMVGNRVINDPMAEAAIIVDLLYDSFIIFPFKLIIIFWLLTY